jgi:ABC-type dipeptide/oligopeptide/nickel transport system permease subunit
MATRKKKLEFQIKRFKNFLSTFRRSKKGIVGVAIIIFYTLIAIFAPIIAPYDPITPMRDIGQYPGYGPGRGPKIADRLCYPSWYKYLPWVYKGLIQVQDQFYSLTMNLSEIGLGIKQFFGLVGKNASDTAISLSNPCINITKIEIEMPNGTKRELTPTEWAWNEANPRKIEIRQFYPNQTKFTVNYYYGKDIVENKILVEDFKFSQKTSLEKWQWNNSENIKVTYDEVGGTENEGCIRIEFSEAGSIHLLKYFNYTGLEPPRSFMIHVSARIINNPSEIRVVFYRVTTNGTLSKPYYVSIKVQQPGGYNHYVIVDTSEDARSLVGKSYGITYYNYPSEFIFRRPGTYAFGVEISSSANSTVFIDNLNCILYGNAFGLLGTDSSPAYPRDLFSALIYGSRVSLIVGLLSAILSTLIGLVVGLIAGFVGGFVDETLMRFTDLLLVLPTLPLFIVLAATMKVTYGLVSIWNIIIILSFLGWMSFSRTVRSMVLSLRERAFVEAAKAAGASTSYIIFRHILPNVFALVYITLATSVPGAIITEASLSWLGLGDPSVPSWGKTLYDFNVSGIAVSKGLSEYWFWIFPPCIAIMTLAIAFILIGFALDEILNPRLRMRR